MVVFDGLRARAATKIIMSIVVSRRVWRLLHGQSEASLSLDMHARVRHIFVVHVLGLKEFMAKCFKSRKVTMHVEHFDLLSAGLMVTLTLL